jgi:hypothetical protein
MEEKLLTLVVMVDVVVVVVVGNKVSVTLQSSLPASFHRDVSRNKKILLRCSFSERTWAQIVGDKFSMASNHAVETKRAVNASDKVQNSATSSHGTIDSNMTFASSSKAATSDMMMNDNGGCFDVVDIL